MRKKWIAKSLFTLSFAFAAFEVFSFLLNVVFQECEVSIFLEKKQTNQKKNKKLGKTKNYLKN